MPPINNGETQEIIFDGHDTTPRPSLEVQPAPYPDVHQVAIGHIAFQGDFPETEPHGY